MRIESIFLISSLIVALGAFVIGFMQLYNEYKSGNKIDEESSGCGHDCNL